MVESEFFFGILLRLAKLFIPRVMTGLLTDHGLQTGKVIKVFETLSVSQLFSNPFITFNI